jgi:hypothetical protein
MAGVVVVGGFLGGRALEAVGVCAGGAGGVALFFLVRRETVAQEGAIAAGGGNGREVVVGYAAGGWRVARTGAEEGDAGVMMSTVP